MAAIQTGPVYRCWVCGRPARRIIPFREAMGGTTLLDKYADYIGYLDLDEHCRKAGHPSRVARLGNAITPLVFPERSSLEERIRAIQEAVECLTCWSTREETVQDRIIRLLYLVHVGAVLPEEAFQDICDLAGLPIRAQRTWDFGENLSDREYREWRYAEWPEVEWPE